MQTYVPCLYVILWWIISVGCVFGQATLRWWHPYTASQWSSTFRSSWRRRNITFVRRTTRVASRHLFWLMTVMVPSSQFITGGSFIDHSNCDIDAFLCSILELTCMNIVRKAYPQHTMESDFFLKKRFLYLLIIVIHSTQHSNHKQRLCTAHCTWHLNGDFVWYIGHCDVPYAICQWQIARGDC